MRTTTTNIRCHSRRRVRSLQERSRDWFFWIAIGCGLLVGAKFARAQEDSLAEKMAAAAKQIAAQQTAAQQITGGGDGSAAPTAGNPALAPGAGMTGFLGGGPAVWTSREGLTSALQIMLLLTVLSLAPAVLLMTTCFVRIVIVLGLLRQAIGLQQSPPSQVITSIALFMTILIMTPVWSDVYHDAIEPYSRPGSEMTLDEAWQEGVRPIRRFMCRQIDIAGNTDDIRLFYQYMPPNTPAPATYEDVPLQVLLPAFMLSELKTAFLIGFQIFLPFVILDIVIASVTISMGMMMLPPVMISLPFKLLLFVLVDGWRLVVGMLLQSFGTFG